MTTQFHGDHWHFLFGSTLFCVHSQSRAPITNIWSHRFYMENCTFYNFFLIEKFQKLAEKKHFWFWSVEQACESNNISSWYFFGIAFLLVHPVNKCPSKRYILHSSLEDYNQRTDDDHDFGSPARYMGSKGVIYWGSANSKKI